MSYAIRPEPTMRVRLMFAASQPQWIDKELTAQEYMQMFLTSEYQGLELLYIWRVDENLVYDCLRRMWMRTVKVQQVSNRFLQASESMTAKDKFNVRRLVRDCMKDKLDLGEDE